MKTQRFCTSCQTMRDEEGGQLRRGPAWARWMCQGCAEKKTPSIYRNTSGQPCDVRRLMADLERRYRY